VYDGINISIEFYSICQFPIQIFDTFILSNYFPRRHSNRTLPILIFAHDRGRTLTRAECGYPNGSPNENSYGRNQSLYLSIQRSPQRQPKRLNKEPLNANWQKQVIVKASFKWSTDQIHSLILVLFLVIIFNILFISFSKTVTVVIPISYRGSLLSTFLPAIV
jgi:hypothetical protein